MRRDQWAHTQDKHTAPRDDKVNTILHPNSNKEKEVNKQQGGTQYPRPLEYNKESKLKKP